MANPKTLFARVIKASIPLIIVCVALLCAWYFIFSTPTVQKRTAKPSSPQVQVMTVSSQDTPIIIRALGTIIPSDQVALRSRVSGQVAEIDANFIPGNIVKQGEVLIKLDTQDLQNELKSKQSSYNKAKADLELEMGQQNVAQTELKQLESLMPDRVYTSSSQLALRVPQLAQAKANLDIADAALDLAKANIERATITAPFDALVMDRKVALGATIGTQDIISNLVSVKNFWVDVAIALDRVQLIDYSKQQNVPATIILNNGQKREGTLLRITGNISDTGRMAKALVDVLDPLAFEDKSLVPLMLGDQVSVEIIAENRADTVSIPREALRTGDTLWVATPENTLDIRQVEVYWKDNNNVYISSGIKGGEKIVVSNLGAPIQNMSIRPWESNQNNADAILSEANPVASPTATPTQNAGVVNE